MKSVHFKKNNVDKGTTPKIRKTLKPETKITSQIEIENNSQVSKPDYSEWIPSRDWHKYLSGENSDTLPKHLSWGDCLAKEESNLKTYEDLMLVKPPDKLVDIQLPTVNFCSEDRQASSRIQQHANISDLGDGDKSRIAQLVQELARCKQDKREDEETILVLKNKVAELKASMRKLLSNRNSENKTISKIQSQHEIEQLALKNQLSELNQLIYQLQLQKATTEVQLKTIASQAEKMTKVIHEMHRENTDLQVELRVTKERLSVAQNAVEKITKDLQDVQHQIKPITEDKACQSVEDFGTGNVQMCKSKTPDNIPDDQRILCELFFNKSIQNDFAPKETVIIIPSDSIPLFKTN